MKLPPFALERYFEEHEFSAPYMMCASDCETLSVAELLAMEPNAEAALQELPLHYTEARGGAALREAVAALYTTLSPDQTLVHSGAGEAIFTFMQVALAVGDHAVVHAPGYQSLAEVARAAGAEVSSWRGDPERDFALDLGELERLLRPNTKLIVVNFPHNPTGYLPDAAFVGELVRMAEARAIRIFSDEVYRGLEHDPTSRLPALADLTPFATSLGVLSKSYGLAGLRIGWLASHDRELLDRASALKDYLTICNSAPSEFLAAVALRHHERIAQRNRALVLRNLDLLDAFFARQGDRFRWRRPNAGPIAFPRYQPRDGADNVDTFCSRVLASSGVLLLPGTLYGEGHQHVRVGFGRANLPAALGQLEAALAAGA
jgi:aspartate/methionine/tyrosine aminotransferase